MVILADRDEHALRLFRQPEIRDAFIRDMREALRDGGRAMAEELAMLSADWDSPYRHSDSCSALARRARCELPGNDGPFPDLEPSPKWRARPSAARVTCVGSNALESSLSPMER